MIGHQEPACMHDVQLGARCVDCGGVVGGDGPDVIEPGQLWRARSAPYGKVGIVRVRGHRPEHLIVEWMQGEGLMSMEASNFRDEFWFWGVPGPDPVRAQFDQAFAPLVLPIEEALATFHKANGYAPTLHIAYSTDRLVCAVEWPNEDLLKKSTKSDR